MDLNWLDEVAGMRLPDQRRVLEALRSAIWKASAQGTRLAHRLSVDREVQRTLLATGLDSLWLKGYGEEAESSAILKMRYAEMLGASSATSSRYSLVRSGHVARWGSYYCLLPPRRITSPYYFASVIVSMEPFEIAASRLANVGVDAPRAWGLTYLAHSDAVSAYPQAQDWLGLLEWPLGLPIDDPDGGRRWLTNELSKARDGAGSPVLDVGTIRFATGTSSRTLGSELTAVSIGGRNEPLGNLFSRPPTFWGGMPLDQGWVALPGYLREEDEPEPERVVLLIEKNAQRRRFLVCRVRPFFRMLIFAIMSGVERSQVRVKFIEVDSETVEIQGAALREVSGPLLTWLTLISDSLDRDERGSSTLRVPFGLVAATRALLSTHGVRSEGVQT